MLFDQIRPVATIWTNRDFLQKNRHACLDPLIANIERVLQDKQSYMITSKGYRGWAHPRARSGDQIYILSGCTVPVILRSRKEGGFILVGDAYVQGFMEGEAVKAVSENDWMEIEIH